MKKENGMKTTIYLKSDGTSSERIVKHKYDAYDYSDITDTKEGIEVFHNEFINASDWNTVVELKELIGDKDFEAKLIVDWQKISKRKDLSETFKKEFKDKLYI